MRAERERAELPRFALAGYTNAGKSTLLNAVLAAWGTGAPTAASKGGAHTRTSGARGTVSVADRLFHTLDPTTRAIRIGGPPTSSPTPSASSASCPTSWSTLSARRSRRPQAELVLHVLDASEPRGAQVEMRDAVEETLKEIGADESRGCSC